MRIRRLIAAHGAALALLTVTGGPAAATAEPYYESRWTYVSTSYSNCPVDEPAEVECLRAWVSASFSNERWGDKRYHGESVYIDAELVQFHADGSYESHRLDQGSVEPGIQLNGLESLRSQGSMTMDRGTRAHFNVRFFGFGPVTREYSSSNYYEDVGCPPRYVDEVIAETFDSYRQAKPAGFVVVDGARLLPGGLTPSFADKNATMSFTYEYGDCIE